MSTLLKVDGLVKRYYAPGWPRRETFTLQADFQVDAPRSIGLLGPNGSGKTTLFELVTGSNLPSEGRVLVEGRDIHKVRYRERDRLAIHYHQSYQVRAFRKTVPSMLLERAGRERPLVHLFDEPQFSLQDGYIGFMLDFFRKLRAEGRLVVLCLHPTAAWHLEILAEIAEQYLLVADGGVTQHPDFAALTGQARFRNYLGAEMTRAADALCAGSRVVAS